MLGSMGVGFGGTGIGDGWRTVAIGSGATGGDGTTGEIVASVVGDSSERTANSSAVVGIVVGTGVATGIGAAVDSASVSSLSVRMR